MAAAAARARPGVMAPGRAVDNMPGLYCTLAGPVAEAGAEAVEGFRKVMLGMINEQDRHKFLDRAPPTPVGLAGVKR